MSIQSASVVFSNSSSSIPDEEYWLRLEQDTKEDIITAGEVAELLDELYQKNPCYGDAVDDPSEKTLESQEESKPTKEMVINTAKRILDIDECRRRKDGTYNVFMNVYKSHLSERYTLRLNVGRIVSSITVEEDKVITITVEKASHIRLDFPIKSGLYASWVGGVTGSLGTVSPPVLKEIYGNIIFWNEEVSGTLRIEFRTAYDYVEIEVPGIPKFPGSILGDTQDCYVLGFYHYQVYETTLQPPDEDDLANQATLGEVCGWETGRSGDETEDEDDGPDIPEYEPPFYGCVEESLQLGDPNYYKEICCEWPPGYTPNNCARRTAPNPGGKTLPQEKIDELTRGWSGQIEFIPVGPTGPEGCGTIYYRQTVQRRNCCDGVPSLVYLEDSSVEVIPDNSYGTVFCSGGIPPYTWTISSSGMGFNPAGTLKIITTNSPSVVVFANDNACGTYRITVTDGCSSVNGYVRSTNGQWERVLYQYTGDINVDVYWPKSVIGYIGHADFFENSGPALLACKIVGHRKYQQMVNYGVAYSGCWDGAPVGGACPQDAASYGKAEPCSTDIPIDPPYNLFGLFTTQGVLSFDLVPDILESYLVTEETPCGFVGDIGEWINYICVARNCGGKGYFFQGAMIFEWRC